MGSVAVLGASGHTGQFVVGELGRRGITSICIGRNAEKLEAIFHSVPQPRLRTADMSDPVSLDRALTGAELVINCAGPFINTAFPVISAAIRAGIPYLDVTAEQAVARSIFDRWGEPAKKAGVPIIPAAAFFGGLPELLASAIAGAPKNVREILVAVGLDSWRPTQGTRVTGQRSIGPRFFVEDGVLQPIASPAPTGQWAFPSPLGQKNIHMLSLSEMATLGHLGAKRIEAWINEEALRDVRDPACPPPDPSDERGRSAQQFVLDVEVEFGGTRRRATATGRDIYYVSAPIIVEAACRLLAGEGRQSGGVHALGEIFDAKDFLGSFGSDVVEVRYADNVGTLLLRN